MKKVAECGTHYQQNQSNGANQQSRGEIPLLGVVMRRKPLSLTLRTDFNDVISGVCGKNVRHEIHVIAIRLVPTIAPIK